MEESAGEAPLFNEVASVARSWIFDYLFASLCHYFIQDDQMEDFQRTCNSVEVLLDSMPTLDSKNTKSVLIAQFLTRVAEGKHLDVQFEADEKLTPLETAAMVLCQIEEEEESLKILQEEIETLVRIQAVAVCMEKGKFKLSTEVLDRQFEDSDANKEQKYLRMKLSMVISKKDPYHEFLENFSYFKMLKKIKSYISIMLAKRPPPFLLQAATKVVEAKIKSKIDMKSGENNDLDEEASESLEQAGDNSSSECENLSGQEHIDLNHNEIGIDHYTEDIAPLPNTASEKPRRRLFSLEQRTPWHPDKARKITISRTILKKSHDKKEKELHRSSVGTKKRQHWTWEEDLLLKRGVNRYGAGNWHKILTHFAFNNRTGVMLKDRWRTMKRLNIVDEN